MKNVDLVIIGGGMVGLMLAAKLKDCPLRIALIEGFPSKIPLENITHRVSALNPASQMLLEQAGIWQDIMALRATPYNQMEVWEKDGFAKIGFCGKPMGLARLGYIVENHLIQQLLWEKAERQKNLEILTALPQTIAMSDHNAVISLDNGQLLSTKLVVGADGAASWVRKQADIPLIYRDYGHHALVCNVTTAQPHENKARQIFSKNGILAFLPLHQANLCSIVWSQPPDQAQYLLHCDEAEFNHMLSRAFDNRLGLCALQSERKTIPLTARYARDFAKPRIALIGDAAHTIHPLAGLGVNLGFQDAQALAGELEKHFMAGMDIGEYRYLRYYERTRKVEAVKMLAAMQGLKTLFNGDHPLKKLVRGIGVNLTDRCQPLKEQLMLQALGL